LSIPEGASMLNAPRRAPGGSQTPWAALLDAHGCFRMPCATAPSAPAQPTNCIKTARKTRIVRPRGGAALSVDPDIGVTVEPEMSGARVRRKTDRASFSRRGPRGRGLERASTLCGAGAPFAGTSPTRSPWARSLRCLRSWGTGAGRRRDWMTSPPMARSEDRTYKSSIGRRPTLRRAAPTMRTPLEHCEFRSRRDTQRWGRIIDERLLLQRP